MALEEFHADRQSASLAAAAHIAAALSRQLARQPEAALVVCGGTTPAACFTALAQTDLPWSRVCLVPSDERWVAPADQASNERLVRQTLMTGRAATARLQPLFDPRVTIEQRCADLDPVLAGLPLPFATALLGMGEDGHFASLFPDADDIAAGLSLNQRRMCLPVRTAASPWPRISLTLAALLRSESIILLLFGAAKRAVYEEARTAVTGWPVTHLLQQAQTPVRVIWAP